MISLLGAAAYLPEDVVPNAFFGDPEAPPSRMFRGAVQRRHARPHETATGMIAAAARRLAERLSLDLARDVDAVLTNVTVPDNPCTGCGAEVAHALGMAPRQVLDLHNGGCVSFVVMLDVARALIAAGLARSALLCAVGNAAGRIYAHPKNRRRPEAIVPGDGAGVGYVVEGDASPVRAIVRRDNVGYAADMRIVRDDGSDWWAPSPDPGRLEFTPEKILAVMTRGNRLVPEVLHAACREAGIAPRDVGCLVTNQPNPLFLRNWREAMELHEASHVHTFPEHGNLFGAAIPVAIGRAEQIGRLRPGMFLAMGGFAHAGDLAAAAVVHWRAGA
ncbi:MAG: 3-oxoacyl-[acyl-carrier-protein] synthase III C-terminal domain-containing protein [Myxococcota bacterium]